MWFGGNVSKKGELTRIFRSPIATFGGVLFSPEGVMFREVDGDITVAGIARLASSEEEMSPQRKKHRRRQCAAVVQALR